jgi:hypothetical protein
LYPRTWIEAPFTQWFFLYFLEEAMLSGEEVLSTEEDESASCEVLQPENRRKQSSIAFFHRTRSPLQKFKWDSIRVIANTKMSNAFGDISKITSRHNFSPVF